jgi:hypothetical protein
VNLRRITGAALVVATSLSLSLPALASAQATINNPGHTVVSTHDQATIGGHSQATIGAHDQFAPTVSSAGHDPVVASLDGMAVVALVLIAAAAARRRAKKLQPTS